MKLLIVLCPSAPDGLIEHLKSACASDDIVQCSVWGGASNVVGTVTPPTAVVDPLVAWRDMVRGAEAVVVFERHGLSSLSCCARSLACPVLCIDSLCVHMKDLGPVIDELICCFVRKSAEAADCHHSVQLLTRLSPLPLLGGYKFSTSGFDVTARKAATDLLAGKFGATVDPRLELNTDCLLLPIKDPAVIGANGAAFVDADARQKNPKIAFAASNGIPTVAMGSLQSFLETCQVPSCNTSESLTEMTWVRVMNRLRLREKPPAGAAVGPSGGPVASIADCLATTRRHISVDEALMDGLPLTDFWGAQLPVVFVLIGAAHREAASMRWAVAVANNPRICMQPAMTSATTHVVLGKMWTKRFGEHPTAWRSDIGATTVNSRRHAECIAAWRLLQEFIERTCVVSLRNVKSSKWLRTVLQCPPNALKHLPCAQHSMTLRAAESSDDDEDDEDHTAAASVPFDEAQLRSMFFQESLFSGAASHNSSDPGKPPGGASSIMSYGGLMSNISAGGTSIATSVANRLRAKQSASGKGEVPPTAPPPPPAQSPAQRDSALLEQSMHHKHASEPNAARVVEELMWLLRDLAGSEAVTAITAAAPPPAAASSVPPDEEACNRTIYAALKAVAVMMGEVPTATLLRGVTFVCEVVGEASGSSLPSCPMEIHRVAALRLLIKTAGGKLVRKTSGELAQMVAANDPLLRRPTKRQREADGPDGSVTVALLPHSYEVAHGATHVRGRKSGAAAVKPLRDSKSVPTSTMKAVSLASLRLPTVTSTWILGCYRAQRRLPLFPVRRALLNDSRLIAGGNGYHSLIGPGLAFLRWVPATVHPYADLMSLANSGSSPSCGMFCDSLTTDPPSLFLTKLRYVKHQRRTEVSSDAMVEPTDVGSGVHLAIISAVRRPSGADGDRSVAASSEKLPWVSFCDAESLRRTAEQLGGHVDLVLPSPTAASSGARRDTLDQLDFRRITHVVTDGVVVVPQSVSPSNDDSASVPEGRNATGGFTLVPPSGPWIGAFDDMRLELLRLVQRVVDGRDDVVLVDASWLLRSAEVGYFVSEDAFTVGPPSLQCEPKPTQLSDEGSKSPCGEVDGAELDLLAATASALDRSVGDGNSCIKGPRKSSRISRQVALDVVPPKSESVVPVKREAARAATTDKHDIAIPMTITTVESSTTTSTAVNSSVNNGCFLQQPALGASSEEGFPCRVYVLSTVSEIEELRRIITSSVFQRPVPAHHTISAPRSDGSRRSDMLVPPPTGKIPLTTKWTHFLWVASPTEADMLVANEVTQRESVLMALAAGLWIVRPEYVLRCGIEGRILQDVASFEWTVDMLSPDVAKKRANVLLAENVKHWRVLREACGSGPFSPPCIRSVVLVDLPHADVLTTILMAGGCGDVKRISMGLVNEPLLDGNQSKSSALVRHQCQIHLEAVLPTDNSVGAVSACSRSNSHANGVVVFLVTSEYWRRWGNVMGETIAESCGSHRQWLQRAPPPPLVASATPLPCHYPATLHNADGRRLAVAVYQHDWVSLVLQKRADKLSMPLFMEFV